MFDKVGVEGHPDVLKDVKEKAWEKSMTWEEEEDQRKAWEELKAWDADFVKLEQAELACIFEAARFLDIRSLVILTSVEIKRIEDEKLRTAEEVARASTSRKMTTPEKDPEEEDEVRRENQ